MQKQKYARVILSFEAQKMLSIDVYQRRYIESCGVLLGTIDEQGNWLIERVQPLRNIFDSPVYFEFAPEDLLTIELSYPGKIVGVYHSHPTGFAKASSTDRQNMHRVNLEQLIPWAWLILRGPFDEGFSQQPEGLIPIDSIIAYHYYAQEGLQQLPVIYKKAGESTWSEQTPRPEG